MLTRTKISLLFNLLVALASLFLLFLLSAGALARPAASAQSGSLPGIVQATFLITVTASPTATVAVTNTTTPTATPSPTLSATVAPTATQMPTPVPTLFIPASAPVLQNGEFECTDGYASQLNPAGETVFVPNHWQIDFVNGSPVVHTARTFYTGSCDGTGHVERIGGVDSMAVRSQEIETPPEPGKPFDVAIYQQVPVVAGAPYALSGWLLSLCGGSAVPNDCPKDSYIAKLIGLDPTGGTDPLAASVVWTENRDNFISPTQERIGWANLRVSTVALPPTQTLTLTGQQPTTITIFARLNSPFQWHGAHGFIDSLSLVRAPLAELVVSSTVTTSQTISQTMVRWLGQQSPDAVATPGGNYHLYFDVEVRHVDDRDWQPLVTGADGGGSILFTPRCQNTRYLFRVRARAEQPPAPPEAAFPNHRYPGVWSTPATVEFRLPPSAGAKTPTATYRLFLPVISGSGQC